MGMECLPRINHANQPCIIGDPKFLGKGEVGSVGTGVVPSSMTSQINIPMYQPETLAG